MFFYFRLSSDIKHAKSILWSIHIVLSNSLNLDVAYDNVHPVNAYFIIVTGNLDNWSWQCLIQVHPYTYRNENMFLHFNFNQDPYEEYEFWIHKMGVDGLFTDFTGSLHNYLEWTSPLSSKDSNETSLLHKIAVMVSSYERVWNICGR